MGVEHDHFIGYREYPKYGIVRRTAIHRRALMAEVDYLVVCAGNFDILAEVVAEDAQAAADAEAVVEAEAEEAVAADVDADADVAAAEPTPEEPQA